MAYGKGKALANGLGSNKIVVRFPPGAPDEILEAMLVNAIESAAAYNTWWYLDQWAKGHEPPCCAGCAELRFVPDPLGTETTVETAPAIMLAGSASCGPAVAMSLGHERAALISKGATWEEAMERVRPVPEQTGGRYWHAVIYKDGERDDPTEEMKR
jgi:hypothetical protein